jgi:ribosomal protein S27AE
VPFKPKPPCRVCRRLHCTDPSHAPKPRQRGERRLARPEYNTSQERRRRKAAVDAFLAEHGHTLPNGDVIARCPECGEVRARFIADHVTSIAEGGAEDGPLRVHCARCSGRQGARLSARRKRKLI